jgi:HD-like signal output (HDOD) protein
VSARGVSSPESTTPRLPLQPLTARAVLRVVTDPDASAAGLSRLVELDPALSATVLRMANASYFGVSGRVAGARQAVVMLGVKSVSSLAVSRTASLVFSEDDRAAPPGYWTHSIATAVACGQLAPLAGISEDEAFTTGMLHDIGALVRHADESRDDGEDELSPTDAAVFGSELLTKWGFPRGSSSALRLLYADPSVVHEPMARVLIAGHALASTVVDAGATHSPIAARDGLAMIGVSANRLDEFSAKVTSEVDRIATFLMGAAS